MKLNFIIALILLCCNANYLQAQDLTSEQKEQLRYKTAIFLSDNEEIQALWYEDLMDRMKLKDEVRDVYHNIVKYHAYKMKRLDTPNIKLSTKQIKTKIEKQIELLNDDAKDILDSDQLKIHEAGWDAILKAITKKINDN